MASIPVGRFCRTEEVAATTLLFAENGYITGKVFPSKLTELPTLIFSRWRTISSLKLQRCQEYNLRTYLNNYLVISHKNQTQNYNSSAE